MPNYIYMGHGADIVTNGNYDYRIVPHGCNYATIAKTGLSSKLESVMNLIKINLSRVNRPYLDDPVLHYNKISMLAAGYNTDASHPILSLNDLHLKTEGEEFINNSCDFIFIFGSGHEKYLYKSGLYDMSNAMTSYLPTYKHNADHTHFNFNHTNQHKIRIDTRVGIDFQTVKFIYKDSVFPTSKAIVKEIKRVMSIPSRPSSAPSKTSKSSVVRRTKSASKSKKSYNHIDSVIIPYTTFVAAVTKVVNGETGFSLMEKFPGNHYNFVCRDLSTHMPSERMLIHRAHSNNRANINRNRAEYIGHKRANPILNFRSFLERFMTNDTRMKFGRTRLNVSYTFLFDHLIYLLNSYLISATRKPQLVITIDNFIVDLNAEIESGRFTIREVPAEIMGKLTGIVKDEPPLVDGEPFIFHKLV